jgi:hypothetical protein
MGFSLLRWRESGRAWSRGEPPPRGSVEYCGVPEVFQPAPQISPEVSGGGWSPLNPLDASVWVVSATELDAAKRWVEAIARSVDYHRRVHGDKVLSAEDSRHFTDFYKRWSKFASRVGTWSLIERAKESNKAIFEALLSESGRLHSRFSQKDMATIPVPHVTDLVLLLRGLPKNLSVGEMSSKLGKVADWGQAILDSTRTTGEWVQKVGLFAASAALMGPAGVLFVKRFPLVWSRDHRGLEKAVEDARHVARYLGEKAAPEVYGRGEPVYDEFAQKASRVYVEAAGLAGVKETKVSAVAEAVDEGAKVVDRGNSVLWLLGAAGAAYLGSRWLDSRNRSPEPEVGEDGEGDVVVLHPGDQVVVGGDGEGEGVYDPGEEEDEHA